MGLATIIVSFLFCIVFNIFLNSFDVYSDIALAINTLTFNLGDSILLSGCKVCHGKVGKDIFSLKNKSCQFCLTRNKQFECGLSFQVLDKIIELEKSETCEKERFGVNWNFKSKRYDMRNETCKDDSDWCCVERRQKTNVTHPLDSIDKRILA